MMFLLNRTKDLPPSIVFSSKPALTMCACKYDLLVCISFPGSYWFCKNVPTNPQSNQSPPPSKNTRLPTHQEQTTIWVGQTKPSQLCTAHTASKSQIIIISHEKLDNCHFCWRTWNTDVFMIFKLVLDLIKSISHSVLLFDLNYRCFSKILC